MIDHRPFDSLGRFRNDWLNARHHFSFSEYYEPSRMNWGPLRVWNDDQISAKTGFPSHGHRDMEIITYVRQGAITHQDGLGNKGRTVAGDVQVMSAGTGIMHSEYNLEDEDCLLFQIWIQPSQTGIKPRWETKTFPGRNGSGLVALASGRDEHDGALKIYQDAALFGAKLARGERLEHVLGQRQAYLVSAMGKMRVVDSQGQGVDLSARDGAAIGGSEKIIIEALEDSELVLADVA